MTANPTPAVILVVEDDASLRAVLVATLKAAGHRPIPAKDAAEGRRWFTHHAPDLVLLDLGLPDESGLALITAFRERGSTPIVVLSAREAEAMKVQALDLGADDYVTKPFGVDELLARLRAAMRHGVQTRGSAPVVRTGDLIIDMGARSVFKAGEPLKLSPKEYDLLCALAERIDQTVTHKALLQAVWGSERADIQYLRVYIGQLRQKLEGDDPTFQVLTSQPGAGYRLAKLPAG